MEKLGNVKGTLVGKVIYGNVQQRTTKDGKEYEEFSIGLQLPNGSTVFVRNRVFEKSREVQSLKPRIELLEKMVEDYKNEDMYARLRLKPDENTGENKYGKFTTYVNKDGKVSFSAEGFLDYVEHEVVDDKVKLIFTNQKQDRYNVDFDTFSTDLTIIGYVKDVDGQNVHIVDSSSEYPSSWNIVATNEISKKLQIGQMYGFVVRFEKGEQIKTEEKKTDDLFSFVEDFSVSTSKEFASDSLKLISGGILSKVPKITFNDSPKSNSSNSSKVSLDDDFPF